MKAKKKITIDLDKEAVEGIIRAYFVNEKNTVVQEVEFNVSEYNGDCRDDYGIWMFDSITCTREDEIEL